MLKSDSDEWIEFPRLREKISKNPFIADPWQLSSPDVWHGSSVQRVHGCCIVRHKLTLSRYYLPYFTKPSDLYSALTLFWSLDSSLIIVRHRLLTSCKINQWCDCQRQQQRSMFLVFTTFWFPKHKSSLSWQVLEETTLFPNGLGHLCVALCLKNPLFFSLLPKWI